MSGVKPRRERRKVWKRPLYPEALRGSDGRHHPWAKGGTCGPLTFGANRPQTPSPWAPLELSRQWGRPTKS